MIESWHCRGAEDDPQNRDRRAFIYDLNFIGLMIPRVKAIDYIWEWKYNLLPDFCMLKILTAKIKLKERTCKLVYDAFTELEMLRNNFSRRVVHPRNTTQQEAIVNEQCDEKCVKIATF